MQRYATIPVLILTAQLRLFAGPADTETVLLSGHGPADAVPWDFTVSGGRRAGEATTIPVPSNWELQGFGGYNYGHDRGKADEKGLYRRTFFAPAAWKDKCVRIVFEGVMTDTEVRLNGQPAGPLHQGGFYEFAHDISALLRYGATNMLEVAVSKVSANGRVEDAERIADFWVFGGIYRPVRLEILPPEFIEHTAIDARADGTFRAWVFPGGKGDADRVAVTVLDSAGRPIGPAVEAPVTPGTARIEVRGRFPGAATWSAETPVLHTARFELRRGASVVHRADARFGFRTFEVRPGKGLFLNGRQIRLKGVCRHSFRPESGRCLDPAQNVEDVQLIKALNMNAVRCSHYPPDRTFLEACDELGLYVLDELAGWQKEPYDTPTGERLVREMVARDANHPAILFWDNGNEGGWNTELDDDFAIHDPQARPILHPWAKLSGVDTDHYEHYSSVAQKLLDPTNVFMPTEHLHGLYDGGHGAGMADHWGLMKASPNSGGLFFWDFADEGVVRTDQGGRIDVDGLHAPDGVVGPHHEREGSCETIRELWSPVQMAEARRSLPAGFDGALTVSNEYSFLNLSGCRFAWRLESFPQPGGKGGRTAQGTVQAPDVAPGAAGPLNLGLPAGWRDFDVLAVTAADAHGRDLWTWTWPLRPLPTDFGTPAGNAPAVTEDGGDLHIDAGGRTFRFSRADGTLKSVDVQGRRLPLAHGPRLAPVATGIPSVAVTHAATGGGHEIGARASDGSYGFRWIVRADGSLLLEARARGPSGPVPFFGLTFDWPEKQMKSVQWLGDGPYRVWKNRMHGTRFGLFSREFNDPVPGESWAQPEFKGCFSGLRWAVLESPDGRMTVDAATPDLFLRLGTPRKPKEGVPGYMKGSVANVFPPLPDGDLSFLAAIPPIGTKFSKPDDGGPSGAPNLLGDGERSFSLLFRFDAAR